MAKNSSPATLNRDLSKLGKYLPLTEVARRMPCRREGRERSPITLYRWTSIGLRGVKLRYVNIGSTRCTTVEWLEKFFASVTAAGSGRTEQKPGSNRGRRP
jgi:hypothetical protein